MGIVLTPTVSTLESRAYMAIKREGVKAVKSPVIVSTECFFDDFSCGRPIPQFIDINDQLAADKNDFFTFVFDIEDGLTITATIENITSGETAAIDDNTFGFLTDLGGFPLRPRVWGFRVDWNKVRNELGFGCFEFNFVFKNSSNTEVFNITSPCFKLIQFTCEMAHGTVRFETLQTGYIFNGFDYRDLFITTFNTAGLPQLTKGWKQQLRWYGRMWPDRPDEETDFIQDSGRIERQIQQKITEKYKVLLRNVKSNFGQNLIKDNFLADEILISDYNMNNYEFYRNKSLRKVSTDEMIVEKLNSSANITLTFKDVDEGTVKRIYG
jgi:hypothetical protein